MHSALELARLCGSCTSFLRKGYAIMQQEDTTQSATAPPSSEQSLGMSWPDSSYQKVARVLERAIALDLLPASVKLGNTEIDTEQYIAELADIARHSTKPHKTWAT
jgi:hypothetical protein